MVTNVVRYYPRLNNHWGMTLRRNDPTIIFLSSSKILLQVILILMLRLIKRYIPLHKTTQSVLVEQLLVMLSHRVDED